MSQLMRFLLRPMAPTTTAAEWAALTLTLAGVIALPIGLVVMLRLNVTERDFYLSLLALVAFMFASFGVGQLAVIADRLKRERTAPPIR